MTERLEIELHNRAQAWGLIQGQLFPFLKGVMQGGALNVTVPRLMGNGRKRTPDV